jgi:ATP-dependent Lhr-like helicase
LFPPFARPPDDSERSERWAWLLLRRYGVMFRDLLARESCAPAWAKLAAVYRKLEMKGEIRGGRFVGGVAGEQFALPEAVDELRKFRDESAEAAWHCISAVDPLNLVGIITAGPRVPAKRGNRVAFRRGQPVAALESKSIRWLVTLPEEEQHEATRLIRGPDTWRRQQVMKADFSRPLSTNGDHHTTEVKAELLG